MSDNKLIQLSCPHCGHPFLHHLLVEIFEREQDESSGLHVVVTPRDVAISTMQKNNPSPRHRGIIVRFWCENCPGHSELTLVQHEGASLLEHRKVST